MANLYSTVDYKDDSSRKRTTIGKAKQKKSSLNKHKRLQRKGK